MAIHPFRPKFDLFTFLAALAACLTTAAANNWPSFRGLNGDGIGTGNPPTEWNIDSGKNICWKKQIEGLSLSSPIIWGNKVILTTAVGTQKNPEFKPDPSWGYRILREKDNWQFKVLCLDKHTGQRLWERTAYSGVPKQGRHSESSYANPTPATDGINLVASFGSHGLFCYDLHGKLRWKTDLGQLSGAPSDNSDLDWGYSSSPIIHAGRVIIQCDTPDRAFIAVIELASGRETLSINRRGSTTWSTPTAIRSDGREVLVCNGYQNTAAFDLKDGQRLWWLKGRGDIPVPRPVVAGDTVYVTAAHGGRSLHAINLNARGDLTPFPGSPTFPQGLKWWSARQGSYIPTPLVLNGIVYVANERGIVTALNSGTGQSFYTERLNADRRGSMSYGSPVTAGNNIFIPKNDGKLHIIRTGRKFQRLATHDLKESLMTTPAISEGRLYLRTRRHLYCIGSSNP